MAAAGREGRERLWDLAERVYPDVPAVPLEEAWRTRAVRTLRALGIMRPRVTDATGRGVDVGEGVRGRRRMRELFEFDYQLEMYKPAARRRWGYWAMPILQGDRLVGKLDATTERDRGALWVDAVHEDEPFDPALDAAVDAEVEELARWLDLEVERGRPASA